MDENDRMREQSLLEFEVQEIEEANLKVGEDEELEERFNAWAAK
jgi:DNA repair protein RecN (Recombination protein N)